MPRLNIIALTTPSHEHIMTYATTKVERKTKRVRRKERNRKKKARQKTVMIKFNDMHLHVPLQLAMGARNEHAAQLWPSRVHVYLLWHHVFSTKKKVFVVYALYRSRAIEQQIYWWVRFACRRVLCPPSCFFRCLFRVADSCAVFFFVWCSCQFLSSLEKKRKEFDQIDILVSCPSEHHLKLWKERSSAPSKWCSLDNSRKGRHGVCEIHVRAILRCDSSEWRVTASGFSIARLSRRGLV